MHYNLIFSQPGAHLLEHPCIINIRLEQGKVSNVSLLVGDAGDDLRRELPCPLLALCSLHLPLSHLITAVRMIRHPLSETTLQVIHKE